MSTFPFYLPVNRGIREWLLVWMLIVDHCPTNFLLQHPLSIENERTPDVLLHWLRYYCVLIWLYYYCKIICRRQTTIGLSSAALEIEHNRRPILFVFVFFSINIVPVDTALPSWTTGQFIGSDSHWDIYYSSLGRNARQIGFAQPSQTMLLVSTSQLYYLFSFYNTPSIHVSKAIESSSDRTLTMLIVS